MTNAEKFKEVFPNVEVNESQKGFVVLHFKTKFNGYEYQESLAVWNSTWLADYQGEPTIPLSVIEKIKAEITSRKETCDKAMNDKCWLTATNKSADEYEHYKHAFENCLGIIDYAVKECIQK